MTQIQLEKASSRINSSMFKQSKDSKYKETKLKFPIVSKTRFDEPLGQLSSLSSRDWVEKEIDEIELHKILMCNKDWWEKEQQIQKLEDERNKNFFTITKEAINKLENIRSLSELSKETKIPIYNLMNQFNIKASFFDMWGSEFHKGYLMKVIKENLCKYMNL
jgi:hypothetical protein